MRKLDPQHRIPKVQAVCEECQQPFIAKTTKTKICYSEACTRKRQNRLARERAAAELARRLGREPAMGRAS